jgi:hypothetical protein
MYFASNSAYQQVSEWVFDDGLINFTLLPVSTKHSVPEARFTPRLVFMTQSLFLNMNLYYKPATATKTREEYPLGIVKTEWPYDLHQFFLEYVHFGAYSSPSGEIKGVEETQTIKDVVKKIEKSITEDVKEGAVAAKEAGVAVDNMAAAASKEVKAASAVASGAKIADDSDPVNI